VTTLSGCKRLLAMSAAVAALAPAVPVSSAHAQIPVGPPIGGIVQGGQVAGAAPCAGGNAPMGIGGAGMADNQICGVTAVYVAGNLGQKATATGGTIVGSTVLAPVSVGVGPVVAGGVLP
jgi:hypothetical protein